MRIAVIGTGISGLAVAHLLHADHDVTIFEANDYVGGHSHTVDVSINGHNFAVDTGFIVFNERTYPNLVKLLKRLGVAWKPSIMSFSVRCEATGLEYCPTNLDTLFAQRRNLLSPGFWRMLRDVGRFKRRSPELLDADDNLTLGRHLDTGGYSREFVDYFIIPMAAAIWSADPEKLRDFPASTFVRFFTNHGFLNLGGQPHWLTVEGGSRSYVEAVIEPFRDRIRLSCPVRSVRRRPDGVDVQPQVGPVDQFDHVVIATHSDQALGMLADPSPAERGILGSIPYKQNHCVLHTDTALLPKRRKVWASWNYHLPSRPHPVATLTYDMSILQSIKAPAELCETLNRSDLIDPAKVLMAMDYAHPAYNVDAIQAQRRRSEISGVNRTHYCGAYWGYGFHEDGVNSALAVGRDFGKTL